MKKDEDLKKLEPKKMQEELAKTEKELFKIKFDVKNEQSKSSHLIRKFKKRKARIKTLMNQPRSQETKKEVINQ